MDVATNTTLGFSSFYGSIFPLCYSQIGWGRGRGFPPFGVMIFGIGEWLAIGKKAGIGNPCPKNCVAITIQTIFQRTLGIV